LNINEIIILLDHIRPRAKGDSGLFFLSRNTILDRRRIFLLIDSSIPSRMGNSGILKKQQNNQPLRGRAKMFFDIL